MNLIRFSIVVLATAVLAGCTSSRKITIDPTLTLQQVIDKVNDRNDKIKTLNADGSITIESPTLSSNGSFVLTLKKPDSLRMDFNGPFGIKIGTLAFSKDQFLFYNWMDNRAIIGKPDSLNFQSLFRIKFSLAEMFNAFTGDFDIDINQSDRHHFFIEDGFYVLHFRTDDGVKEYRINGENFIVSNYRFIDREGCIRVNAEMSRYEKSDECFLPRFLRVVFPKDQQSISIAYDDIEINKYVDCRFALPKQAEVISR